MAKHCSRFSLVSYIRQKRGIIGAIPPVSKGLSNMRKCGGEPDREVPLRAAQIGQLYQQGFPGLIGALLGAIILTIALWDVVSHLRLLLWLGIYVLLQIPRLWLVASFRKAAPKGRDVLPWGRWFALGGFMGGLMWGIAGVFLFPPASSGHQFLLSVFVTGIACGAAVSYAPLPAAYIPPICLEMVPLSGRFIYGGAETDLYIGSVVFLFTFILLLAARNIEVANEKSLCLMFEKGDLVDSLTAKTEKLEDLSETLKAEIDERKKIEKKLMESLEEKSVLLREIHHRVKNNLAVVGSLLSLQSRHAKDEHHREMFVDSRDRIRSIALAHEKLYQSESMARISSRDYLQSLVSHLFASVGQLGSHIHLRQEIAEVELDLETAVTLGLVVNELVTNCLKHAFPDGRTGYVTVALEHLGESFLELRVADDGIGLPESINLEGSPSLGLNLLSIFSRQIKGHLEVHRNGGTDIRIRFSRGEQP